MAAPFLQSEPLIRLGCFAGVFVLLAAAEWIVPRRRAVAHTGWRWTNNLALVLLNTILVRLIVPLGAVAVAVLAEEREWGLFPHLNLSASLGVLLGILALDLAIYLQHVLFHAVPLLWRLHRVHHTDTDFDVTTGTRFHPVEILLSVAIKCAAVAAIGAPAVAVLAFEVLLNATAMFNHANARLPAGLDTLLRWLLVTPDMHRVHHSIEYNETNSNFGFNLPWWDRLFGTYRAQPAAGHVAMTIGVDAFRDAREMRMDRLLLQPLRDTPGGYAINRRPELADRDARVA